MVAQCANENCKLRFESFSEGRLFQFEVVSVSMSAKDVLTSATEGERRQSAQFWLCGNCAGTMTLVLEPAEGLRLIPLGTELPQGAGSSSVGALTNSC